MQFRYKLLYVLKKAPNGTNEQMVISNNAQYDIFKKQSYIYLRLLPNLYLLIIFLLLLGRS